jgi:hypothetical protein
MHPSLKRFRVAACVALLLALALGGQAAAARPAPQAGAPTLSGGFADFWRAHDGARLFGAPLTAERQAGGLVTQIFERARLEWHPDYPPGRQITLGRLGAEALDGRAFPPVAPFASNPGHRYFAATGHSVQGDILRFWDAAGGLPIFGLPLSEELVEDGHTVQYFERARLEHHPDLPASDRVTVAPLGALAAPGATGVVFEPSAVQEGRTVLIKVLPPAGATRESARLGDRALVWTCCLPFTPGGARGFQWAVAGAPVYQGPDSLTLALTMRLPGGGAVTVTRSLLLLPGGYPTLREVYNGPRLAPALRDAEHATIAAVVAGQRGAPAWSGPFRPPLRGPLTVNSPFGQRRAYNQEPPYEVHTGVDLAASAGTPVYAPAAGRVVWAQPLRLRGNTVIIDHGAGVFTLYAHLSAYRVAAGQAVAPGDLIALVGSTGNALGPHLHWEVIAAGEAVLPQEWLARALP